MASAPSSFSSMLDRYWDDDFAPLQAAAQTVLTAQRADEDAPDADLYRRMASSGPGSHLYFPSGSNQNDTTMSKNGPPPPSSNMKHIRSVPLPPTLALALKNQKSRSLMGLLPQAKLAWMSVDHEVFLWSFYGTETAVNQASSLCCFAVPSGQSVIACGLARPKKGIFKPSVKWCLVVTTPDEVILCALNHDSTTTKGLAQKDGVLQLVPTSFTMQTDNVRMISVTGTQQGRIFLGGEDGCLYEMAYALAGPSRSASVSVDVLLDQFYDEGKNVPSVISADSDNRVAGDLVGLGKRAWVSLTSGGAMDTSPPRKCRKLNISSNVSSLAAAVVPGFILSATSFLFGNKTSTGGGMITRMCVDEERKCLYTLCSKGWICAFDLTDKDNVKLSAVMNAPKVARLYLEAVSRGQSYAPNNRFRFPGGGPSAQAGVGGMEGARAILKLADAGSQKANRRARSEAEILKPATIHIVPQTESSRLTLVAVTAGGLRLYISSLSDAILNSGRPNDVRGTRNPLAPSNKLTLCHIRAPPPSDMDRLHDLSSVDAGVVGGVAPRVAGSLDKMVRADASFYHQGILVTAVERKTNQGELGTQHATLGDIIVAACPDSIARKKVTPVGSQVVFTVPGGITEATSMPMTAAYGAPSDNSTPVLPGGFVWDFALVPKEESATTKLAFSSQTPSESELGVGLPPAYFPPSKVRSKVPGTSNRSRSSSTGAGAIVPANASLSSTALSVIGNVVTNYFLSRPIRHGLSFERPMLGTDISDGRALEPSYRISNRDGAKGFSATAAEKLTRYGAPVLSSSASPSKTSRTPHSARLRQWLLRPAVVPLNQMSTQHITDGGDEVVALNAGGLHYFGFNTILSSLAETLMSAGESVNHDPATTRFFTSYSYAEGCAMCLALAVGCGPAGGNSEVRSRATAAALSRAYVPKLIAHSVPNGNGNAPVHSASVSSDKLVPPGYTFKPSALSEGLTSLFSRLVRPVWNKPTVVVTEGRSVKLHWSTGMRMSPAKVEILLDESTINDIRRPLRDLMALMQNVFDRAIKIVPGVLQREDHGMMDIDDEGGQFVTGALQYQSHVRGGGVGQSTHLNSSEAENIAHLIEEKNIHSLYRLLARVVQLLDLQSLLRRAHDMSELREVDWGMLHGLTFSQLVQTSEGQERLETLLNSLVTSSASKNVALAAPSAEVNQLAGMFADKCYLFFSPGSRFALLGLRAASDALATPTASSRRAALTDQAALHFINAAKHWYSASLISGRILHAKNHENYAEVAVRAMQHDSPLAKAVDALVRLGDVGHAVDICLTTASNFMSTGQRHHSNRVGLQAAASGSTFSWEQDLYHRRRNTEHATNGTSNGVSSSPVSPSHLVASGATVTSRDAVETCYALVFYHLSTLLSSRSELADRMVSACAYATDKAFLCRFFLHLLENEHTDTLLRIDSHDLEVWLRERKDPDLLWRYYSILGKHAQAGQVSFDRATDAALKLDLGERVACLSRALNSFTSALEERQRGPMSGGSVEELAQKVTEVTGTLHVARLQNRVLRAVDAMKSDLPAEEITEQKYEQLSKSLVQVSDLYNQFAATLGLFDHCLLILHSCRHDDEQQIQELWKSVICEELFPCSTRNEEVFHFLQAFVSDLRLEDSVRLLSDTQAADSLAPIFENGEWMKRLEGRIVSLGNELFGNGAGSDKVFPVDYLLFCLESLRQMGGGSDSLGWPLITIASVGVPYLVILEKHEDIAQREDHILTGDVDASKRLDQYTATVNLLSYWVSDAAQAANPAREELLLVLASGRLMPKIDILKAKLEAIPEASAVLDQLQSFEEDAMRVR